MSDFIDKILLAIGLQLVSASLSGMIRALVPITTAFLSVCIFNRPFTCLQICALLIVITGVSLGCLATMTSGNPKDVHVSYIGVSLLIFSSFTIAMQNIIEQKLFEIDSELTVAGC